MFASKYVSIWNKFRRNCNGTVALMFGLTIIPLFLFAGAALDYSRLTAERARFQAALDSAALAAVNLGDKLTVDEIKKRVEEHFFAAYGVTKAGPGLKIAVTKQNSIITISGSTKVQMTVMKIAGYNTMEVGGTTSVTSGRKKIEIALVLDNTGSMGRNGKMAALKAAVNDLIDGLKKEVVHPDDVKMSIVPFNTEVRIAATYNNASWLRWDVVLENSSLGWAQRQPPSPAAWNGCLADRDQPYDISSKPAGIHVSRFVAAKCHANALAQMEPLTTDLEKVRSRAQSMAPNGYTNIAIGYTMGLATLRKDSPFGSASSDSVDTAKFMIVLTDGDNTRNRWSSNASTIDARLSAACIQARANAPDNHVKIFTIRVVAGNATLLKSCASEPTKYFDVKDASGL